MLVLKFSRSTYSRMAHIVAQNVAVKDSINLLMFFSPFDNVFDLKILKNSVSNVRLTEFDSTVYCAIIKIAWDYLDLAF